MKRLFRLSSIWLCMLATTAWPDVSWTKESILDIEPRFDQAVHTFLLQEHDNKRRGKYDELDRIFIEHFGTYLEANSLSELEDVSLEVLYRALNSIVFHTYNEDRALELVKLSKEIETRGQEVDPLRDYPFRRHHLQNTYENLINARLFDFADNFAAKFKDTIQPFLVNIDFDTMSNDTPKIPALFILEDTENSLRLKKKIQDVGDGRWFVAVVHPGCAFSRRAMEYIENNTEEFSDMPDNTLWVTSQGSTARPEPIHAWNRNSEIIDIAIAYKDNDWPPEILLGTTPAFYLLVNGVVTKRIIGWPDDETRDELTSMLREFRTDSNCCGEER